MPSLVLRLPGTEWGAADALNSATITVTIAITITITTTIAIIKRPHKHEEDLTTVFVNFKFR